MRNQSSGALKNIPTNVTCKYTILMVFNNVVLQFILLVVNFVATCQYFTWSPGEAVQGVEGVMLGSRTERSAIVQLEIGISESTRRSIVTFQDFSKTKITLCRSPDISWFSSFKLDFSTTAACEYFKLRDFLIQPCSGI